MIRQNVLRKMACLAMGLLCAAVPAWGDETDAVRTVMQDTIDKTTAILGDDELRGEANKEERRTNVRSTLLAVTDARRVSLLVLGRHRSKFNESEIQEFCDAFAQLVFVTYITQLEKYQDEEVRILSVAMQPKSRAYAATLVVSKNKEIPAGFSLFKDENDAWKIYDVKVEGVSMVSNYRSQFSELLLKRTPAEVIANVKKKVKENE
jgi:phospholipid transport system substrate-binding protein